MDSGLRSADNSLLGASDVANRLGISTNRVYDLARMKLLPVVRIGRQVRFDGDAIEAWIEAGGAGLRHNSTRRT